MAAGLLSAGDWGCKRWILGTVNQLKKRGAQKLQSSGRSGGQRETNHSALRGSNKLFPLVLRQSTQHKAYQDGLSFTTDSPPNSHIIENSTPKSTAFPCRTWSV
ncbi:tandem C2 domains nuclear protein [Platysternon megacephalum]|uniref:Tandem C2 domains nuclear protein n=1 Tax=Platysternon megacephalum TaxID=55544 RepID=A0A4D9F903_9SAUR|nr:tandem C2 domains nuclear protein [Platysternon megacephalum]